MSWNDIIPSIVVREMLGTKCSKCKFFEARQRFSNIDGWCLNSDYVPQVGYLVVDVDDTCRDWGKSDE